MNAYITAIYIHTYVYVCTYVLYSECMILQYRLHSVTNTCILLLHKRTDKWIDGWMDECMYGWMLCNARMYGWNIFIMWLLFYECLIKIWVFYFSLSFTLAPSPFKCRPLTHFFFFFFFFSLVVDVVVVFFFYF